MKKKVYNSDSLSFQICLQMAAVCTDLKICTDSKFFKQEFDRQAKIFRGIAKAYKEKKREVYYGKEVSERIGV